MKKQTAALITAGIMIVSVISGCGTENAARSDDTAHRLANEYFAGDAKNYPAWSDIDRNELAAYVEGTDEPDFFNVTFGEFYDEYMYYLATYQITDDMVDDFKSVCESYRKNIINYITFERLYLHSGEHDYDISEATLSDEEKKQLREAAESVRSEWAATFYNTVSAELGEGASQDEIDKLCDEVLDVILEKCGISSELFYKWEVSRYIEERVTAAIAAEAVVTEDKVDEMYTEAVNRAKDLAENSPAEYENNPVYLLLHIPEGTRTARHIYLSYTEDELSAISEAQAKGDTAEKERLVTAAAQALKEKTDEVSGKLSSGAEFGELQEEYGTAGKDEYVVLRNSPSFFDELKDALYSLGQPGDVSEAIVCDNGVYFVMYSDNAAISAEDTEAVRENMRSTLKQYAGSSAQSDTYAKWVEKYPYTINYDLLKISPDE